MLERVIYIRGFYWWTIFCEKQISWYYQNYKLTQLIDKPTRVTPSSVTLLRLVITNRLNHALSRSVVPQVIADHDLRNITIDITKAKRQPGMRIFRHLGRYSKGTLCDELVAESDNFNQIMNTDNVNSRVNIFNEIFINCLDKCVPVNNTEVTRPAASWHNDALRLAMKQIDDTRSKINRGRSITTLLRQYTKEKKATKYPLSASIKEYYAKKFNDSKGNSSPTWKLIK